MDCPYDLEIPGSEFFGRAGLDLAEKRIPLGGSLELTWRCNLGCAHCYLTAAESWPAVCASEQELTTEEFIRVIDEAADAGCLFLLLTGGEPLVRRDFLQIYMHAKRRGLLLTIFTNGTLLDEALVEELGEWPPRNIEITLYGATRETYERITGVPGSYARCIAGIELLLKHGLPLRLKTMIMTHNVHELDAMKEYAGSLDVPFRFDAVLNACVDSSTAPLSLRLKPENVVALQMGEPEYRNGLERFFDRQMGIIGDRSSLFHCGAGINRFHIDSFGKLSICMMVRNHTCDLRQQSFLKCWKGNAREVRSRTVVEDYACLDCTLAAICDQCPGWSSLESGSDTVPVDYLCKITHLRAEALGVL